MGYKKKSGRKKTSVVIDYDLLRQYRKARGMTQTELAEILGYTPSRITQFEGGYSGGVPMHALKKMGEILEFNPKDLILENGGE